MLFEPHDPEQEKEDFFDGPDIPEEAPTEQPKKPVYRPDDPAYWDEEESEWEHLKPRSHGRLWLWLAISVVAIGLIAGIWMRFFSPYIDEATQYGYVDHIEYRGTVFHTYEGVLIPYKELMDTTRIYRRDFIFSAENDKVAAELKRAMLDARPVRVEYRQYHATLPWRGSSKTVITKVDSVDPEKILPPEFR